MLSRLEKFFFKRSFTDKISQDLEIVEKVNVIVVVNSHSKILWVENQPQQPKSQLNLTNGSNKTFHPIFFGSKIYVWSFCHMHDPFPTQTSQDPKTPLHTASRSWDFIWGAAAFYLKIIVFLNLPNSLFIFISVRRVQVFLLVRVAAKVCNLEAIK